MRGCRCLSILRWEHLEGVSVFLLRRLALPAPPPDRTCEVPIGGIQKQTLQTTVSLRSFCRRSDTSHTNASSTLQPNGSYSSIIQNLRGPLITSRTTSLTWTMMETTSGLLILVFPRRWAFHVPILNGVTMSAPSMLKIATARNAWSTNTNFIFSPVWVKMSILVLISSLSLFSWHFGAGRRAVCELPDVIKGLGFKWLFVRCLCEWCFYWTLTISVCCGIPSQLVMVCRVEWMLQLSVLVKFKKFITVWFSCKLCMFSL